jgi:membrane fusion protein, multidrug efflux system
VAQNETGKKSASMKTSMMVLLLIIVIAVVSGAVYWYKDIRGFESTDDAFISATRVSLGANMLGRVISLAVDEGDLVQSGQLLVQLDDSDLQAQLQQARANLDLAKQNSILASVNVKKAREDFERSTRQFSQHIIPQEQYDHARQALEIVQAQQAIARAKENSAVANISVVESHISNTQIFAPINGVIARKWVSRGDVVQPGQTIFTIYDPEDVWVEANFEETKIRNIHQKANVDILIDAYADNVFKGHVDFIGAAAASQFSLIPPNNASGNFTKVTQRVPVKIVFDQSEQSSVTLRPGMSVEVKIKVE